MTGKYIVCCKDIVEFVQTQKFCFSIGLNWENGKHTVEECDQIWLRVDMDKYILEACGEPNKYLNGEYDHVKIDEYKFINVESFTRKIKLERLGKSIVEL